MATGPGPDFQGHIQAARNFNNSGDVIEGRPGIIESTHIDPLREDTPRQYTQFLTPHLVQSHWGVSCLFFFPERNQWEEVEVTSSGTGSSNPGMMRAAVDLGSTASNMVTGAMKMAYGSVSGNDEAFKAGKEA